MFTATLRVRLGSCLSTALKVVYPTNTFSATVAFLLLPDTNLLPQAGITHCSQLLTRQHSTKLFLVFFFSSLTTVPSENQCLSSGAYEWPVLVSLKHAVGLSQHWFLLQEWFRESLSKLMVCSPTCELHSRHLGCGLELIPAVYRGVHAHSFVLKCLLQWHVHAQHY